jgi:hypothetical protein
LANLQKKSIVTVNQFKKILINFMTVILFGFYVPV